MPRTPITSNYTQRSSVSTSYNSRKDGKFLMTQALDFLMTENNNFIVLQDSYTDYSNWNTRTQITTNYS